MPSADFFAQFGPARWTAPDGRRTYKLAASSVSKTHERRVIMRRRPYLDGAPLDDTGAEPRAYELALLFANGHGVPGVPDPAYPDYHAEVDAALEAEGTSTLYVPGKGEKRVRVKRTSTMQIPTERDCEVITISVVEDREDERATADSFVLPSAKSALPVVARRFLDDASSLGMGSDLLSAIERGVNAITAAANAPFDSAADLQQRVEAFLASCDRCEAALTRGPKMFGAPAAAPFLSPEAASVRASLQFLRDAAHGQVRAAFGAGSVQTRRFGQTLSIFEIAARLGQDPADLVRLNAKLPSVAHIPAGTPVLTRAA